MRLIYLDQTVGTFFIGLQLMLMFPRKYPYFEPLTTSYDVLKALWHLAPPLVSRSQMLVRWYQGENRTGVKARWI